ncbi:hypothetical protein DVH24_013283 [Malus domestica]|uniref:Uncharacterized protein n=1 Tax=Malus domestica TaxID=3750 RepID=A0A498HMC7_MALDO|nr:hypothetical protein DVH24_013283 [Malus domestica]
MSNSDCSCVHETFWELTGFGFCKNSEVKRERGQSIPRMGDPLRSSACVGSQKQNREELVGGDVPYMYMLTSSWHEAFGELTDFGFHRNSEVKRVRASAISRWYEAFWEHTSFGFHRNSEVKRVRARAIPGWVIRREVLV